VGAGRNDLIAADDAGREASYDVFISYAGEDRAVASELATELRQMRFQVWYDRFELRSGDRILDRINDGLNNSEYGVLIVSAQFLAKPWPRYETDVLVRNEIEGRKKLLPVWHGVSKAEVEQHQPGLAGVYALSTDEGIPFVARELAEAMVGAASTICEIPGYMEPIHRFLVGRGELQIVGDGVFTLWEALRFPDERFPIWAGGRLYSREDLLVQAWQYLSGAKQVALEAVGADGIEQVRQMLIAEGLDPDMF
jgi:TIR domain